MAAVAAVVCGGLWFAFSGNLVRATDYQEDQKAARLEMQSVRATASQREIVSSEFRGETSAKLVSIADMLKEIRADVKDIARRSK